MAMNDSAVALNASHNSSAVIVSVETYLLPIVFGIIFVSGVIGNGSLMFIICRYKSMRNLPNIFIFNLALGDLFVLLFALPFTTSVFALKSWPFGELVCKASEFAKDTSVSVSVFTLTALSFDRYNIIVKPVESYVAGPKSKKIIIICLAVIWAASLALAIPAAIFSRLIVNQINSSNSSISTTNTNDEQLKWNETENETSIILSQFCYPFPDQFGENGKFTVSLHAQCIVIGRLLIQYLIPLVVIGTFYTLTARKLMRSTQNIDGQATATTVSSRPDGPQHRSTTSNNNQESRRKVALTVQIFVAVFFICFLTTHIYFVWFYFTTDEMNLFWYSMKIVGFVFAYANSCINPIALYFISSNFRKHLDQLLFCCCRGGNRSDDKSVRARPPRRQQENISINYFQHHHSNPQASSLEHTTSFERTTSM